MKTFFIATIQLVFLVSCLRSECNCNNVNIDLIVEEQVIPRVARDNFFHVYLTDNFKGENVEICINGVEICDSKIKTDQITGLARSFEINLSDIEISRPELCVTIDGQKKGKAIINTEYHHLYISFNNNKASVFQTNTPLGFE